MHGVGGHMSLFDDIFGAEDENAGTRTNERSGSGKERTSAFNESKLGVKEICCRRVYGCRNDAERTTHCLTSVFYRDDTNHEVFRWRNREECCKKQQKTPEPEGGEEFARRKIVIANRPTGARHIFLFLFFLFLLSDLLLVL
jgi:DNA-directed RNA polymerase subunit N (RpoN/RPB10)